MSVHNKSTAEAMPAFTTAGSCSQLQRECTGLALRIESLHGAAFTRLCPMQDDLFGHQFEVCDDAFGNDSHTANISVPGEFDAVLSCPTCSTAEPAAPALTPQAATSDDAKHKCDYFDSSVEHEKAQRAARG